MRGWHDRNHLLELGISIASNGARWTGLEYREADQGQHDGVSEVLAVSTAGALIRRDVFEELDGFDPELSLFRDDVFHPDGKQGSQRNLEGDGRKVNVIVAAGTGMKVNMIISNANAVFKARRPSVVFGQG